MFLSFISDMLVLIVLIMPLILGGKAVKRDEKEMIAKLIEVTIDKNNLELLQEFNTNVTKDLKLTMEAYQQKTDNVLSNFGTAKHILDILEKLMAGEEMSQDELHAMQVDKKGNTKAWVRLLGELFASIFNVAISELYQKILFMEINLDDIEMVLYYLLDDVSEELNESESGISPVTQIEFKTILYKLKDVYPQHLQISPDFNQGIVFHTATDQNFHMIYTCSPLVQFTTLYEIFKIILKPDSFKDGPPENVFESFADDVMRYGYQFIEEQKQFLKNMTEFKDTYEKQMEKIVSFYEQKYGVTSKDTFILFGFIIVVVVPTSVVFIIIQVYHILLKWKRTRQQQANDIYKSSKMLKREKKDQLKKQVTHKRIQSTLEQLQHQPTLRPLLKKGYNLCNISMHRECILPEASIAVIRALKDHFDDCLHSEKLLQKEQSGFSVNVALQTSTRRWFNGCFFLVALYIILLLYACCY